MDRIAACLDIGADAFQLLGPNAADLDQFIDLAEAAVFLAIGFDFAGQVLPYARQLQQFDMISAVEVNAIGQSDAPFQVGRSGSPAQIAPGVDEEQRGNDTYE